MNGCVREILGRFFSLFRRRVLDGEFNEELAAHIEMAVEDNVRAGMNPEEARRKALLKIGGPDQTYEIYRDAQGIRWLENIARDVRNGFRQLFLSPGFAATAVLTLALGIGANAAIFSLIDGLWMRPLPVEEPQEIVRVYSSSSSGELERISYPDYLDFRGQSRAVGRLAACEYRSITCNKQDGKSDETLSIGITSDNFFRVLGMHAAEGRVYGTADPDTRTDPSLVAVLDYGLWQRRYGGDREIVGKTIFFRQYPVTVLGILPKNFQGIDPTDAMDAWIPASTWAAATADNGDSAELNQRGSRSFDVLGRLHPGVGLQQASMELDIIAGRLAEAYPQTDSDLRPVLQSDFQYKWKNARETCSWLLIIVLLLLLIACANVANLLLARARKRQKEIATRLAIGASRFRLIQQLLTESLLLTIFGTAAGFFLAYILIQWLPSIVLPPMADSSGVHFSLDARVFTLTMAIALLTGVVFGSAPAWLGSRLDLSSGMKGWSFSAKEDRSKSLFRHALISLQLALSIVALLATGLMVKSLMNALAVDAGISRENVLTAAVYAPGNPQQSRAYYMELMERVQRLPGVSRAGFGTHVPLTGSAGWLKAEVALPGQAPEEVKKNRTIRFNIIGPNFLNILGARIIRGRDFNRLDTSNSRPVALISHNVAERFWAGKNPIGKILRVGNTSREIVGVVQDTKFSDLEAPTEPYLYVPYTQEMPWIIQLLVETTGDPQNLIQPVKKVMDSLNPDYSLEQKEVLTFRSIWHRAVWDRELISKFASGFGLLGLLLAMNGLWGLVYYLVNQQTREIGIRMALGAETRHVLWHVIRQCIPALLMGLGSGLLISFMMRSFIARRLFGVSAGDPLIWGAVSIVFLGIALLACIFPARRASRIDPLTSLRTE